MDVSTALYDYLLRLGDNGLILGQQLGEWCGHGPVLEQDIAVTNLALDQIGQARSWLAYAGEIEGKGRNDDQLAFFRVDREFRNLLLVEQPNGHWGQTIMRQFFFDAFNYFLHIELTNSNDEQVAAIATKSLKEIEYHLRYSSEWVIRLGDGTEVSNQKMQQALEILWPYTAEAVEVTPVDQLLLKEGIGADLEIIRPQYYQKIEDILQEATLTIPEIPYFQFGGKKGLHSEHLGHILAPMQSLQRAHPGLEW